MLRCPIMAGVFFHAIICAVVGLIVAGCSSGSKSAAPASGPAERSAVERPPRPATLEDVRKTQETQTQEVGRLTGEVKALDAQQAFLVTELKSLSERLDHLWDEERTLKAALRFGDRDHIVARARVEERLERAA